MPSLNRNSTCVACDVSCSRNKVLLAAKPELVRKIVLTVTSTLFSTDIVLLAMVGELPKLPVIDTLPSAPTGGLKRVPETLRMVVFADVNVVYEVTSIAVEGASLKYARALAVA